jgi:SAM-dependent methyltransferase
MTYRETYLESRQRYLRTYDFEEVSRYDEWISTLSREEHEACLNDIRPHFNFYPGMNVLDAGAGTGALCLSLATVPELKITALEPCPAMLAKFVSKPELRHVEIKEGFCDHPDDKRHFAPESFHVVASRQLANGLYDPLAAFRNWHLWLRPSGTVIVMDGLFDRDWGSRWEGIVDTLPLSACRSLATVPYLLEQTGFRIEFSGWMDATNALPSTRTKRYMVVAKKDGE